MSRGILGGRQTLSLKLNYYGMAKSFILFREINDLKFCGQILFKWATECELNFFQYEKKKQKPLYNNRKKKEKNL